MATMSKFPPDVEKDWDDAKSEVEQATSSLRAKVANTADRATESVKDGYYRAKDAISDMDPYETARDGGRAVVDAVERHPLAAFGLGALSIGLIAWSALRPSRPSWEPDFGRWGRMLSSYGDDAADRGHSAYKSARGWFRSNAPDPSDYEHYLRDGGDFIREGGRYLARRGEKEPLAALIGAGIAIYVIGSLISAGTSRAMADDRSDRSDPQHQQRRRRR